MGASAGGPFLKPILTATTGGVTTHAGRQEIRGMSSEFSPEFQAELLDDFYAECDEHLANIRARLTALESALIQQGADPGALESLFRSMHSLKGISAIVDLRPVEELAHAAEDFLRRLTRQERIMDDEGLHLLMGATQRLEELVSAHRLKQPLPPTGELLKALVPFRDKVNAPADPTPEAALPSPETAATSRPVGAAAAGPGLSLWRSTFHPSPSLDQRGINLTTIRARLTALGEILRAEPTIGEGGAFSFNFTVALRDAPVDPAAWAKNGVTFAPTETETSLPAAPTHDSSSGLAEPASNLFIAPSHIVRVDLSRLDELMRIVGELVIQRSRLEERLLRTVGGPATDRSGLQEVNLSMARSLHDLREAISRVRLVSVAEIFTRMPFVARDLAQGSGKKVRLLVEGEQTEVDKYLVERLKDPLLHLVRNAFSHGVETPEARIAAGKGPEATILLRAVATGGSVVIQIRDDGRGMNAAAIARRAAAMGIPVPAILDDAAILAILCAPGFSTREEADRASGRGMGMSVVHEMVRELGGTLTLETKSGQWTRFTLRLPLTLSIAEAFLVSAEKQTCAVPQRFVQEILQVPIEEVRTIQRTEAVPYRDGLLPLIRLRALFNAPVLPAPRLTILVLNSDRGQTGLVVDRVLGQREIVMRALHDPLIQTAGIAGATELGDGRPVLILDAIALTQGVVRPASGSSRAPAAVSRSS